MKDKNKTKAQLIVELEELRRRVSELEKNNSERDHTVEALQKSEMLYRSLTESSPDLIARFDRQYRHLYVNPTAAKTGRYSQKEYIGKTILEVGVPEQEAKKWEKRIKKVFETGEALDIEDNFKTPSGIRYYNIKFVPEFASDGSVHSVQTIARDISERKQAEEALQYHLELEKLISSISADFINMPIEKIDNGINEMLGKVAEFAGAVRSSVFLFTDNLTMFTNTHEWCADPVDSQKDLLQNIPLETFGYYRELLFRHEIVVVGCLDDLPSGITKGERTWVKKHGFRPLLFAPMIHKETLYGTLGFYGSLDEKRNWSEVFISLLKFLAEIIVNALERKRMELALQESMTRYQALFENINNGVAVYEVIGDGQDFIFKDFNRAGEKIDHDQRARLIGKSIFEVRPGIKQFGLIEVLRKVWQTGEPAYHPVSLYQDNRLNSWYENYVYKLPSGEIVTVFNDITERKISEERIQRDLKEKEILLKEIHHRVKNNLAIIISLLNLQLKGIKNNRQALAAFEDIRNRIYSMALVHEHLYKSRDLLEIEMKPYIETLSTELKRTNASEKDINLDLVCDNVLFNVSQAIPCGLIFNELISNAYKHAFLGRKTGNIRISIRLLEDKSYELLVQDNGVGLPEAFNIENPETLGLNLVNILAEQINGKLEIRKEKGMTFIIRFKV